MNNKINFFSRLLLCFFAITGANYLSCAALPHDEFAQSPKFAVHHLKEILSGGVCMLAAAYYWGWIG